MNRIRHYFLELAPEMERYFVLPATDDPWVTLAAVGIQRWRNPWWQSLLTAGSMIVVVNSVLGGAVVAQRRRAVGAAAAGPGRGGGLPAQPAEPGHLWTAGVPPRPGSLQGGLPYRQSPPL